MAMYNKLLLALDLNADADFLLARVSRLYLEDKHAVNVVHVIRSRPRDMYQSPADWERNLELREIRDHALLRLNQMLQRNNFHLMPWQIHIRTGEPANEIKRLAHELGADLVIVGSHCKKDGWLDLPGATTNCVLQGIGSDVMAVRV